MYRFRGKGLGHTMTVVHLAIVLCVSMFSLSFASDDPNNRDKIPAFQDLQGAQGAAEGPKQTIWTKNVNSGCSYSDHDVYIDIDVDPTQIKEAKIRMSNWDVDYNDPQSCTGGPEVDYLYVNGVLIGQLKGANDSWSLNSFDLPAGVLKKGQNHIRVDTDAPGTNCWCCGVGYVDIMGIVGFKITNYTPPASAENVLWNSPGIVVNFSNEIKDSTITSEAFKLDYRDQSGNWKEVTTTLQQTTATRVTVTPTGDLRDGIRYRMRVMSGPNGVKDKNDNELDSTKEWPFSTMVNLDGQTATVYPPNTDKDKLQITWFNVFRNVDLVQNKAVANRIYVLWDEKADVHKDDQVTQFNANVTLDPVTTKSNVTIKRPDKYTDDEKKNAKNTINFYHIGNSGGATEEYKLKVEPVPQTGGKVFEKAATATVRGAVKDFTTDVYACEMAGWAAGAVPAELTNAMSTFRGGVRYTEEVFPISYFTYSDKGAIKYGAGGFNMVYKDMQYSAWLDNAYNQNTVQGNNATCEQLRMVEVDEGGVKVTRPEYEVVVAYMANLQKAGSNNFTVGLLPKNAVPTVAGSADSCITGLSNSEAHVILLLNENFNASTLAHEIGHEFGLAVATGAGCTNKHNNDGRTIEGFRVLSGKNKSFTEGNGEYPKTNVRDCDGVGYDTPVVPVMYQSARDPKFRWMRKDDYEFLLNKFTAATDQPLLVEAEAAPGDWMVVQGYIDSAGTLTYVQPLYRMTQRNISAPTGTGYTAQLFTGDNGTGSSLGSYPFGTGQYTINLPDGQMVTTSSDMFIFSIPYVDTARSLVLTGPKNTLILNKSTFGVNPPSVDFTNPANGATVSGDLNITWNGSDDSGKVYYRLEYSPDGTDWTPLAHKLTATTYTINTRLLPVGANDLAIIAYDGFNTTRKEITINVVNGVGIAGTTPAANQTDVSESTTVLVDFVSPMDAATISKTTFQLLDGGTPVVGTVTYNSAANRAFFFPKSDLKPNTSYTAKLVSGSGGIEDTKGNTLSSDYTWTFVTGATQSNPHVLSVWPENGETDAAVNAIIQAAFDKEMKGSSITTASFTLAAGNGTAVTGTVSYNSANKSAVFTPSSNLAANTTYTATLTTAIVDASSPSNPLVSNYAWTFTTGSTQFTGIRIDGIEYDMALDKNGDGLYDSLLIRVQVEVIVPGTYNLNAQLKDKYGVDITWASVTLSFSQKGVYFVDAEFSGSDIAAHGIDGPYTVTNVYIYNTSDPNTYYTMPGNYLTYPDKASEFYSVIRLSAIPNVVVAQDSENVNVINLQQYATHATVPSSSLQYKILINSNAGVGASISSSHQLDIKPVAGFEGYSDLTLEVKDNSNNRALNTLRVNVSGAYQFPQEGWYLISLPNVPSDGDISKVLSSISGKITSVWAYSNGQWSVFSPDQPGFSDLSTMGVDKAYWLYIKQAGNLSLLGSTVTAHPIHLVQGWNFVGFNSTVTRPVADALYSIAGRYLAVWAYVDGKWKLFDPNNPGISDLTDMEPGYGYWIYATMATDWVL